MEVLRGAPGAEEALPEASYCPPPPPPASGASSTRKGLSREQGAPVQAKPTAAVPERPTAHGRRASRGRAGWPGSLQCGQQGRWAGPRLSWGRFGGAAVGAPVVLVRMRIPGPRPAVRLSSSGDSTLNKPLCSHHPQLTGSKVGKHRLQQELVQVMHF